MTQKHFDELKHHDASYWPINDLLNVFEEEDLIKMFNTISSTNKKNTKNYVVT